MEPHEKEMFYKTKEISASNSRKIDELFENINRIKDDQIFVLSQILEIKNHLS